MATATGKSRKQQLQEAISEFGVEAPETADETALAKMLSELGKKGDSIKPIKAQEKETLVLTEEASVPKESHKENQIPVMCLISDKVTVGKAILTLKRNEKVWLPDYIAYSLIDSKAVVRLER